MVQKQFTGKRPMSQRTIMHVDLDAFTPSRPSMLGIVISMAALRVVGAWFSPNKLWYVVLKILLIWCMLTSCLGGFPIVKQHNRLQLLDAHVPKRIIQR
jgi:hypothetical protein